MQIEKARELGLCFGVRRAVKILRQAASEHGKIETLGPVAHNQRLVEELAEAGVEPVGDLQHIKGRILAIPAHGISPAVLSEIELRQVQVIDTTCPIVHRAQNAARELADAGFDVIVFGDAEHSEVKGLLGWARDRGVAALDANQVATSSLSLPARAATSDGAKGNEQEGWRLGIISQTTQSWPAFVEFVGRVMAALPSFVSTRSPRSARSGEEGTTKPSLEEIRVINTLCQTTERRREAAIELAGRCQLMIVIGGYHSANTRRLAEACAPLVETHLLERAGEVEDSWLVGKRRIGITAGASTPDEAIEETVVRLKSL